MTQETETKRPTHAIYQVIGEGETSYWHRVGAAWANKDGKGLSLKFDAMPLHGRTMIREIDYGAKEKKQAEARKIKE
ncbi:hypothetical protein [Pseudaestuariivita rosea]|uniref:hypothetical protein n=1 Tax=Pseudaestuariivita rosea TaxID=2763263 RepID=UPI001ABB8732|nr:hypothetical protein [Pseudaestuariivita rosea]